MKGRCIYWIGGHGKTQNLWSYALLTKFTFLLLQWKQLFSCCDAQDVQWGLDILLTYLRMAGIVICLWECVQCNSRNQLFISYLGQVLVLLCSSVTSWAQKMMLQPSYFFKLGFTNMFANNISVYMLLVFPELKALWLQVVFCKFISQGWWHQACFVTSLSFRSDGFQCDFAKDIICLLESWPTCQGDRAPISLPACLPGIGREREMQWVLHNNRYIWIFGRLVERKSEKVLWNIYFFPVG